MFDRRLSLTILCRILIRSKSLRDRNICVGTKELGKASISNTGGIIVSTIMCRIWRFHSDTKIEKKNERKREQFFFFVIVVVTFVSSFFVVAIQ